MSSPHLCVTTGVPPWVSYSIRDACLPGPDLGTETVNGHRAGIGVFSEREGDLVRDSSFSEEGRVVSTSLSVGRYTGPVSSLRLEYTGPVSSL